MKKIVDIILDKLNNNKLSDEEKLNFLANCYRQLKNIQQRVEWGEKKYKGYAGYKKIYKKYLGFIEKYIKEIEIIFADKNNNSISDLSQRTKDLSIDIIKNIKNNNLPIINENFGYTFGFTCIFSFIICILLIFFLGIEDIGSIQACFVICSTLVFGILSFAFIFGFIFGKGYEALLKESNTRRFLEKTNEPKNINMLNNETVDSNNINITKTPQQPVVKKSNYNNYQLSLYEDNNAILNAYFNRDYYLTISLSTKFINEYPDYVLIDDAYVYRGLSYIQLNQTDDAFNDFTTAIELYAFDNSTAYLERGKIYFQRKEYQNALSDFNKAIECNSNTNGDDFYNRALLYIELGQIEDAISDLKQAMKLAKGTTKEDKERLKQLLEQLEPKVSKSNTVKKEVQQPDEKERNTKAEQYIKNATDFESQKDYINAINEYTKAISLNPENIVELYIFRAECCMQIQQYKNVVEDCTQAIELSTNLNSNAYYTRGLAYQNLNNKTDAINDIQKAISINPDNQTYRNTLNDLLQNNNTIIDIESCTQEDIVTLGCFSNAKAEKFIQERNNGKIWYDIDSFVQDFELQPHEMVMIQDRIKFPEKPKNKYGRKIDI